MTTEKKQYHHFQTDMGDGLLWECKIMAFLLV